MTSRGRLIGQWLPVFLWMALMASASTNIGSSANTSSVVNSLLLRLFPGISHEARIAVNLVVRKSAHVTEYAVLAVLLLRALRRGRAQPVAGWDGRLALATVLACAAFATGDELFQTLWDQRLGSPWDVALDTMGAALGMCLRWAIGRWRHNW